MGFVVGSLVTTIPSISYAPRFIGQTYAVDLNGDGNDDLLLLGATYPGSGAPQAQPGLVAFGTGNGAFTVATESQFPLSALTTVHPREAVFADFNGDGFKDVFIADHGYDAEPFPGAQNRLFLSNGNGTWRDATANLPQVSDFSHSASAADVNGDGKLDLIVGNVPQPNPVNPYVLLNDGSGLFTRADILPTASGQLLDPTALRMSSSLLADLDGDGLADLVVGSGFSSSQSPQPARIVWNHGGSFAQGDATTLPLPAFFGANQSVYDIQPMDVNHDGRTDLVVAYQNSVSLGGWELQVLVNQGGHVFADQTAHYLPDPASRTGGTPSSTSPESQYWVQFIHPIDLNGDGRMDFVLDARGITSTPASFPMAYVQQADGSFAAIEVSQFGSSFSWIFDYSTQYARWNGGGGFVRVLGSDAQVRIDALAVTVLAQNAAGLDVYTAQGARAGYTIEASGDTATLHAANGASATLHGAERLVFSDRSVALDLAGHAGTVAKILGAVFGPSAVFNADYVGIGLSLADGGMGYADLVQLALNARLGAGASNAAVVDLLYGNVVGTPPTAEQAASFRALLDNGTMTQAALGEMAADHPLNASHIDLVGLAARGLDYLPA
jgi:hypothetical protein